MLQRQYNLTKREIECLSASVVGRSAKAIASILGTSHRTVEHHLTSVRKKMGKQNKHGLVQLVHEAGEWERCYQRYCTLNKGIK